MSKESLEWLNATLEWLNANTLIGFTDKRGTAWHYRADLQSTETNHYPGAIPVDDAKWRLFGWDAVASPVYVESPVTGGLIHVPERARPSFGATPDM
ncbi:hypothetical protein AB0O76_39800 [Streptomyces sp. NPDC086554]|uniref:hypothetical protein n=1 Tax=Streptomyces sp. NPDC086554 TaxID=3154864 RepID=UPI00343E38D8